MLGTLRPRLFYSIMTGGEKEFLNVFTVKGGNLLLSQLPVAQSFEG